MVAKVIWNYPFGITVSDSPKLLEVIIYPIPAIAATLQGLEKPYAVWLESFRSRIITCQKLRHRFMQGYIMLVITLGFLYIQDSVGKINISSFQVACLRCPYAAAVKQSEKSWTLYLS